MSTQVVVPPLVPTAALDFEGFVRDRLPSLLRYATAMSGDPHAAADIVQDVLVRCHSKWARIRQIDRPELYVKRMVTNEFLSWRRRWHIRTIIPVSFVILQARGGVTEDRTQQLADRDDLEQRLATLPRRQRAVLVLRYFEGLDDAEIAEVLEISPGTVRSTASRALATLRLTASSKEQS